MGVDVSGPALGPSSLSARKRSRGVSAGAGAVAGAGKSDSPSIVAPVVLCFFLAGGIVAGDFVIVSCLSTSFSVV